MASWTAPDTDDTVSGYLVELSDDEGQTWWPAPANAAEQATHRLVVGLDNDHPYLLRVAAISPDGTGPFTLSPSAITPSVNAPPMPAPDDITPPGHLRAGVATLRTVTATTPLVTAPGRNRERMHLTTPAGTWTLRTTTQRGYRQATSTDSLVLRAQGSIAVQGSGLLPSSVATVLLQYPDRIIIPIGDLTSDTHGRVKTTVQIPALTDTSRYTLIINGFSADGSHQQINMGVRTRAASAVTWRVEAMEASGRIGIEGVISHSSSRLRPWLRIKGKSGFRPGLNIITPDRDGQFTWQRRTNRKMIVQLRTHDGVISPNVTWPRS